MSIRFMFWDCELVKETYNQGGRIALCLVASKDDPDNDVFKGEPIATATVNIPEVPLDPDEVIIKNYSENEGILQVLINAEVIEEPHRFVQTGFVNCPICRLK